LAGISGALLLLLGVGMFVWARKHRRKRGGLAG
jgi:hypothetical protein